MTLAQQATNKLKEQNRMELKIGGAAAADGAEDCEIYGGEYPEVDIDLQNQQALYFSQ